ncbi:MAG: autotransporter-associated beta strand repeat-containing protein, partial [Anaerolineae bacterium]|nr:autotransporter-associated beta strand repeat-containing protein [Phycisphaerae bacterium]
GNWTGAGGANFSAANSWSNGTVPGNLTAVTFNSSGGGNTNINLGGAINLARITFDTISAAAHTFQAGGTITLNSGGGITITNTVTTTQTFNNAFALSGPTIFANWSATNLQRLTINGLITSATATRNQLALFGNGSGHLNGAISDGVGTIALFKTGDGTWTVSGNNTFSGETYIGSGNLQVAHNNALGSTVGGTTVANGASLQINGNVSVGAEPLSISGDGAGGQGALQLLDQVASGTFGGDIAVIGNAKFANRSFNNGNVIFTLGGKLRGGSPTSTLTFWGSNSNPGYFRLAGSGSDYTGTLSILSTKVILAGGDNTLSPATIVNLDTNGLSTSFDAGVLDLNGTNQTIAGLTNVTRATLPRIVNRANGSFKTLTINATNNFSFAGTIRNDTGQIALTKTGAGNQILSGANTYTGGTTVNGGTLTLTNVLAVGTGTLGVNAGRALYMSGLPTAAKHASIHVVTSSGAIDLNDNDLIVGAAKPQAAVEALVVAARNGGAWDGGGLTSTSAKNHSTHSTTLGVMSGAEYISFHGAGAIFGGQSISAADTLVKYTWYGDTDFSGIVDFDDYGRIDTGFNNGFVGWTNGDFDYNGIVDFDDYSLVDQAFNTQTGSLRSVPEPSGLILIATAVSTMLVRRRRVDNRQTI